MANRMSNVCGPLLTVLLLVCSVSGCRNQGAASNGSLFSADRVPPPATRLPGGTLTAPSYASTAPIYSPATGNMMAAPPATAYPGQSPVLSGTPVYGSSMVPPTLPPTPTFSSQPVTTIPAAAAYPPSGSLGPASSVSIPTDNSSLRFAPPTTTIPGYAPTTSMQVPAMPQPVTATGPWQTGVGTGAIPFTPAPGTWNTVASAPTAPAYTPMNYRIDANGAPAAAPVATDGFRPQGSASGASLPASTAGYGYTADYRLLRGRLEVTPVTNFLSLRYVPIDGTRDTAGGAVLIQNPDRLGDFQPGDFVVLDGAVTGSSGPSSPPIFTVYTAQRQ